MNSIATEADRVCNTIESFVRNGQAGQEAADKIIAEHTTPANDANHSESFLAAIDELSSVVKRPAAWLLENCTQLKSEEDVRYAIKGALRSRARDKRRANSPKEKLRMAMIKLLVHRDRLAAAFSESATAPNSSRSVANYAALKRDYEAEIREAHRKIEFELVRLLKLQKSFPNWEKLIQP